MDALEPSDDPLPAPALVPSDRLPAPYTSDSTQPPEPIFIDGVLTRRRLFSRQIKSSDIPTSYRYSTRPTDRHGGRHVFEHEITNCLYTGAQGPGQLVSFVGDIWVKDSEPVGVWASRGDGNWDSWAGNDVKNLVMHAALPSFMLWFNYLSGWTWVVERSKAAKQREWMKNEALVVWTHQIPVPGRAKPQVLCPSMESAVHIFCRIPAATRKKAYSAGAGTSVKDNEANGTATATSTAPAALDYSDALDDNSISAPPSKRPRLEQSTQPLVTERAMNLCATTPPTECTMALPPLRTTPTTIERRSQSRASTPPSPMTPPPPSPSPAAHVALPSGSTSLDPDPNRLWHLATAQSPTHAESVHWANGLQTIMPYVARKHARKQQKDNRRDFLAVKLMAKVSRLGDEHPDTPFVFVTYQDASSSDHLVEQIRRELSCNRVIVVKGLPYDAARFNEKGFSRILGNIDTVRECANLRQSGANKIHRDVSGREFLEMSGQSTECWNLMDLPQVFGQVPYLIEMLADNLWSFVANAKRCYETSGRELQGEIAAARAAAATDADVVAEEVRHALLKAAGERAAFSAQDEGRGSQVMTVDIMRVCHWDLITMAGFLTYTHHDANGLCTWGTIHDGAKCWGVVRFRDEELAARQHPDDLRRLFNKAVVKGQTKISTEACDMYVVFLEPGDTIIMPPGLWHWVYTPVNTIMRGGHFLMYDSMHLTQWSRFLDVMQGEHNTNADHVAMRRILAQMTMALPSSGGKCIRRKQFVALASMVLNEWDYVPAGADNPPQAAQSEDDIEMVLAYRIIKALCITNSIARADTDMQNLPAGTGWSHPDSADSAGAAIDLSILIKRPALACRELVLLVGSAVWVGDKSGLLEPAAPPARALLTVVVDGREQRQRYDSEPRPQINGRIAWHEHAVGSPDSRAAWACAPPPAARVLLCLAPPQPRHPAPIIILLLAAAAHTSAINPSPALFHGTACLRFAHLLMHYPPAPTLHTPHPIPPNHSTNSGSVSGTLKKRTRTSACCPSCPAHHNTITIDVHRIAVHRPSRHRVPRRRARPQHMDYTAQLEPLKLERRPTRMHRRGVSANGLCRVSA
ncbi:hypothetical protein FA95DRAFT_1609321 [Auriscalpium vulgare]|uniref:Uncharacterized protein n=1 Tax=Auriscalpium vulgare TaxID=40419 RepID=A0ACB8RHZ3_9AGAM|nr:hypothetical protein FA95DRAFT_1609321 [Auriscalpium vulgare]